MSIFADNMIPLIDSIIDSFIILFECGTKMRIKILLLLLVLTIFTACEREDIYDFMEGHTRPLMPEIKVTRSASALFNNDAYTVTMRAKTGAVIEYTINGSDPTPGGGTVYTGPFDITTAGNTQIKAIGHLDLDISEISSTYVTVGEGNAGSPYEIATAAQLNNIRAPYLIYEFIQTANIDLSAYSSGEGWMPIGTSGTPFAGNYNGNGYVITGLKINKPTVSGVGLFGEINSAVLANIALEGINITGNDLVGGIAGRVDGSSTITNCYTTGSVSGSTQVGGLVGHLFSSDIIGSYSKCTVTGEGSSGGLVGFSYTGTISNSYATGNVTSGGNETGGLIGNMEGGGEINQSFAKGKVTGVDNTGGLAGRISESEIYNCYGTGEVISISGSATGGLVGYLGNTNAASINNSYSTGKVTGSAFVGGLLGELDGASIVDQSVWDEITSTQNISAGGSGEITSILKTQTHFESTLGWDLISTWTIQEGVSYPYFQWQGAANIPY